MKKVRLIHNPSAGDEDHKRKELIKIIETQGYECQYASIKEKGWNKFDDETDFLVVAGGDGTVRKVVKELIGRKLTDKQYPIALLPMGTANNIASTFNLRGAEENIARSWNSKNLKRIDIGKITGGGNSFFLEGFGFGVFPRLMKEMKKRNIEADTPEMELQIALEVLVEVIDTYKAKACTLTIDGINYSGNFLLVEVMNIRSIGPNLNLAPLADPGDGIFDVILITEAQRDEFKKYISDKLKGVEEPFTFNTIPAKKIKVKWEGMLAHADDEFLDINKEEVNIQMLENVLTFLTRP